MLKAETNSMQKYIIDDFNMNVRQYREYLFEKYDLTLCE